MGVLSDIASQFLKPFLQRIPFLRTLKPEHAESGLCALDDAETIFKESRANGGYFGEPWRTGGRVIERDRLLKDLDMLKVRAGDRNLNTKLEKIIGGIEQIHVNNVSFPIIFVDGVSNRDPRSDEYDLQKAQAQLKAIDMSLPLILEARRRINILER